MAPLLDVLCVAIIAAGAAASALPSKVGITDLNLNHNVGPGKVSIKQVRREGHVSNGALSIYKTYLKFKAPIPDYLYEAVARFRNSQLRKRAEGSTGTVSAIPYDELDDAYISAVSIGTPAQTLMLDFDTGSSDFWVFSTETPANETSGQTLYDPSASSTSKLVPGETWSIRYGDNSSSSGNVYTDSVTIGGLTVSNQEVECAQKVSDSFTSETDIDGLLGLGFDNLNRVRPDKAPTFFDNAKPSLAAPLFTVDLKYKAPGKYDFGYIDNDAFTEEITYVAVNTTPGYWTWTSSGFAIGSDAFTSAPITGIADTGTTLLYLPDSIVTSYYQQVDGSSFNTTDGGYEYPCSTTLPSFTFGVDTARITIPGEYMNYGPVTKGSSTCFGGLQSSEGFGINIFGDVALKAAFVVFDGGSSPRIGWAPKDL